MGRSVVGLYALQVRQLERQVVELIDENLILTWLNEKPTVFIDRDKLWVLIKEKTQQVYDVSFKFGKWQVEEMLDIFKRKKVDPLKTNYTVSLATVIKINRLKTNILFNYLAMLIEIRTAKTKKEIDWWIEICTIKGKSLDEILNAPTNQHRIMKLVNDSRRALLWFLQEVKNYAEIDGKDAAESEWMNKNAKG